MDFTLPHPTKPWANPDGELLVKASAPRPDWLAARRSLIGASDIAKLFGVSKYGDATTVWADKTGRTPDNDAGNVAMRRGQIFEDPIVQLWAERYADFPIVTRRQGLVRSRRWAHAGATVDRTSVCERDGKTHRCVVEVKSQANVDEWEGDEVPVDFQFQGLWQLLCTGRDHVHYVGMGPRFVPMHRIIERDEPVMEAMLERAQLLWDTYVATDTAPPPTGAALSTVSKLFRSAPGPAAMVDDELATAVHQAREAQAVLAEAQANLDAAKSKLMLAMGATTELVWPDGEPAATWRTGKTIDGADAAWRKANRELAEQYMVPGPDVLDLAKLVENHPELIDNGQLRYRRTFKLA